MPTLGQSNGPNPRANASSSSEHLLRLIIYRKWLVLGITVLVFAATATLASFLPNIYTSATVILVDPQKVPESYVRPTVTGDVRNRLSTLSQQILSETRLQKIIDELHLYSNERKELAREEVVALMRSDISVTIVGELGGGQDLQAFRVKYSGRDPRLVAQVTNELAGLFIEENLKAREQQATGTAEFLENQLQETRKALEEQEAKLRDFKLKHIGEMPEQQNATLQILGQLQSQLQLESEALSRAEQQRSLLQTMASQSAPVVDLDEDDGRPSLDQNGLRPKVPTKKASAAPSAKSRLMALLASGLTDKHPDVRKARMDVAEEEAKQAADQEQAATSQKPDDRSKRVDSGGDSSTAGAAAKRIPQPVISANPVIESQMKTLDDEIAKHVAEQQRLKGLVAGYQAKLESVPVREQEMTELVRDYEISKGHYAQLLEKQLSARTATQLEIRQKGERFSVLDPAQPSEKPSRPNRLFLDLGGIFGGLFLGIVLALGSELFGATIITAPEQITETLNIPVLEVIPVIRTVAEQARRKYLMVLTGVSGVVGTLLGCGFLVYYYRR
jgi:polysaccharide chain length determinant protein (PEP-CTERM system associated)